MRRSTEHESSNRIMTVGDLALFFQVSRSTIYRLLRQGQLPGFKVGSDWRFDHEQIDKWRLEAHGEIGIGSRRGRR